MRARFTTLIHPADNGQETAVASTARGAQRKGRILSATGPRPSGRRPSGGNEWPYSRLWFWLKFCALSLIWG
ncbi:hypothetical protein GCM10009540_70600 [Streptomyces turgidiscabies]